MKKYAIVLSGCGVFDGSEIHEAVLTLLAVQKAGHSFQIFAPDMPHAHVIDHTSRKELPNQRSVLSESARIARGNAKPLHEFDAAAFDVLVFPGGFGVAKNLCDYAFKGSQFEVRADVRMAIESMSALKKPIGALCIAPILLAKVLGGVRLTLGAAGDDAAVAVALGAEHQVTSPGNVVVDKEFRVVTAPCYMVPTNLVHVASETERVILELDLMSL